MAVAAGSGAWIWSRWVEDVSSGVLGSRSASYVQKSDRRRDEMVWMCRIHAEKITVIILMLFFKARTEMTCGTTIITYWGTKAIVVAVLSGFCADRKLHCLKISGLGWKALWQSNGDKNNTNSNYEKKLWHLGKCCLEQAGNRQIQPDVNNYQMYYHLLLLICLQ